MQFRSVDRVLKLRSVWSGPPDMVSYLSFSLSLRVAALWKYICAPVWPVQTRPNISWRQSFRNPTNSTKFRNVDGRIWRLWNREKFSVGVVFFTGSILVSSFKTKCLDGGAKIGSTGGKKRMKKRTPAMVKYLGQAFGQAIPWETQVLLSFLSIAQPPFKIYRNIFSFASETFVLNRYKYTYLKKEG